MLHCRSVDLFFFHYSTMDLVLEVQEQSIESCVGLHLLIADRGRDFLLLGACFVFSCHCDLQCAPSAVSTHEDHVTTVFGGKQFPWQIDQSGIQRALSDGIGNTCMK